MGLLDRIKVRLPEEKNDTLLNELITTATDRICLRLGADELPSIFESICVEVVVKAYRRIYYEGIESESADTMQTSFVSDLLEEYDSEFSAYLERKKKEDVTQKKVVRFL